MMTPVIGSTRYLLVGALSVVALALWCVFDLVMTQAAMGAALEGTVRVRSVSRALIPRYVLRYLGSAFVSTILMVAGLILLVIPGIVVAIRLSLLPSVVLGEELALRHALERSWRLVTGWTKRAFMALIPIGLLQVLTSSMDQLVSSTSGGHLSIPGLAIPFLASALGVIALQLSSIARYLLYYDLTHKTSPGRDPAASHAADVDAAATPDPAPAAVTAPLPSIPGLQWYSLGTAQLVVLWYGGLIIVATLLVRAINLASSWEFLVAAALLVALLVFTMGSHPVARKRIVGRLVMVPIVLLVGTVAWLLS